MHLFTLLLISALTGAYEIPKPEFKIFKPMGFEVSIPAKKNVSLFYFQGEIKRPTRTSNLFIYSDDIVNPTNGRFVFKNTVTSLYVDDIIYYWVYVRHNGRGYRKSDLVYIVTQYFLQYDILTTTVTPDYASSSVRDPLKSDYCNVSEAVFKILNPRGFEVSINGENGITSFAFYGNLNKKIEKKSNLTWSQKGVQRDGRFIFKDSITSFQNGDSIYYWTETICHNLTYVYGNRIYRYAIHLNTPPDDSFTPELHATTLPNTTVPASNKRCRPSMTTINNGTAVPCAGDKIFEENFDGNTLDPNKWLQERRFSSQPDYEFVAYLLNEDVLKIHNGIATIKPSTLRRLYGRGLFELNLRSNCTGILSTEDCMRPGNSEDIIPPLISSQFSTKDRFSFKHGKVEIRAKLPNAAWVFPQMYLEPVEFRYGIKNYQSGQMRIAFSRNSDSDMVDQLYGGVILNAQKPFRNIKLCKKYGSPIDWSVEFHLFTLEWVSNKIIFRVDNEEYCNVKSGPFGFANVKANGIKLPNVDLLKNGSTMAPFDQEFYITLGYGIGGHNDFPDDPTIWQEKKPWINFKAKSMQRFWNEKKKNVQLWLGSNAEFKIDYVKVYST